MCQQTTPREFLQELGRLKISLDVTSLLNFECDRAMNISAQSRDRRDMAFKVLSWLVMATEVLLVSDGSIYEERNGRSR